VWQGEAGTAFRQHLDSTLIEDLSKANQSLNQAMTTLRGWGSALAGFPAARRGPAAGGRAGRSAAHGGT
jgi:hypothetical protein